MTPAETAEALQREFGEAIGDVTHFRGEVSAVVARERLFEVCRYCRDELKYNYLSDVTCVDWLEGHPSRTGLPRFDVIYHLTSLEYWIRFRLKVQVNADQEIPTVIPLWGAATWGEREVWDLFGIEFKGHPDLRRLLLPEGWIGHPLRKDFSQTQISLPRPKADKVLE